MSSYSGNSYDSSTDMSEIDHMGIQQNVAPIDPLEIAFRTALDKVCFLGGWASFYTPYQ